MTGQVSKKYKKMCNEEARISRIQEEIRPTGNKLTYTYDRPNKNNYLSRIELLNSENIVASSLTIPVQNLKALKKRLRWKVTTPDGRWVDYQFFEKENNFVVLHKVNHLMAYS